MTTEADKQAIQPNTDSQALARQEEALRRARGRPIFAWHELLVGIPALALGGWSITRADPADVGLATAILLLAGVAISHLSRRVDALVELLEGRP